MTDTALSSDWESWLGDYTPPDFSSTPKWAQGPCDGLISYLGEAMNTLRVIIIGLRFLPAQPALMEALDNYHLSLGDESERSSEDRVRRVEETAEFAKAQIEDDFPILHAQGIVSLWSGLEAGVEDLTLTWFQNTEDLRSVAGIEKVRIPMLESRNWSEREYFKFVLDQLESESGLGLRPGVAKFEAQLALAGLSDRVDPRLKKSLLAMSQVRHLVVHRRGEVDRRFLDQCPWLGYKMGDRVAVSGAQYWDWTNAAITYALQLADRVAKHFSDLDS